MSKAPWKPEGERRSIEEVWDLEHEKVFLDGLGSHSFSRMPRLEMLKGYLESLNLKCKLDKGEKSMLRTYVKNLIAIEESETSS